MSESKRYGFSEIDDLQLSFEDTIVLLFLLPLPFIAIWFIINTVLDIFNSLIHSSIFVLINTIVTLFLFLLYLYMLILKYEKYLRNTKEEAYNRLMEEKINLEQEFKIILDKNPVTLEEFVNTFISTYKNSYPERINEFKRLLYLSQKRTSAEIEEAIKSYFTNIIIYSRSDFEPLHSSKPIYDLGLIYEFAKKYRVHYDKSDVEKLNKLLIQTEIRFHDIKLLGRVPELLINSGKRVLPLHLRETQRDPCARCFQ